MNHGCYSSITSGSDPTFQLHVFTTKAALIQILKLQDPEAEPRLCCERENSTQLLLTRSFGL